MLTPLFTNDETSDVGYRNIRDAKKARFVSTQAWPKRSSGVNIGPTSF